MNRFLVLSILAIALAACQTPEPVETPATPVQNAADPAADRAEIEALTKTYETADRAGDHAAIAALYADDAVILPGNKPSARGRAAFADYFANNDAEPEDITFTTQDVVVAESGDLAYEVGTIAGPGWAGKYLTVYRRAAAGWEIVADSWSGDAPPPASN